MNASNQLFLGHIGILPEDYPEFDLIKHAGVVQSQFRLGDPLLKRPRYP
jgi:hypothetical protein